MTPTQPSMGCTPRRLAGPPGIAHPTLSVDGGKEPPTRLLWGILALVVVAQCAGLLWLIWDRTPDVPWWDEWETVVLVHKFDRETIGFADFWAFHNEHRIVIPRLIDLSLIELTSWNRQLEMTFDFFVVMATWTLLIRCAHRSLRSGAAASLLGAPYVLLILSFAQYENFLWPFQIAFIATVFGVALSAWALGSQPVGRQGFLLVALGALIASFSSFAGLTAWIAFLPVLWLAGFRRPGYYLAWTALAAAVIVPYARGFPGGPAPHSLHDVLRYACAYLGAPVVSTGTSSIHSTVLRAQAFGLASVAVTLGNLFLYWRIRRALRPLSAWIGLGLFALACDAITSFGRGSMYGIAQALERRYEAFSALWWVATITIGTATVRQIQGHLPRPPRHRFDVRWGVLGGNVLFFAIACLGLVHVNLVGFDQGRHWMDTQRQHEGCILSYDSASDDCLSAYYLPQRIRTTAEFLAQDRLSLFAHEAPLKFSDLARVPQQTRSFIDAIGPVQLAHAHADPVAVLQGIPFVVSGWAVDDLAHAPASGVFVVIDGSLRFPAVYGGDRSDVAAALHTPAYARSGFSATIGPDRLIPGKHTITIEIAATDRRSYYASPQRVGIDVRFPENLTEVGSTRADFGLEGRWTVLNGRRSAGVV